MAKTYYTYRLRVANRDRVQVEKWDAQHQDKGQPSGALRYQEKLPEIAPLLQAAKNNELNDSSLVRSLGEALFDVLFDDVLRQDFVNFYYQVVQQEKQLLRVELDIDEQGMPEIAALPWEFMCVPARANLGTIWMGTVPDLVFSRRRSQWIAAQPIQLESDEKLRIALIISAPSNLPPVAYEPVQAALEKLAVEQAKRVELLPIISSANPETIDTILSKDPHIFQFIGHGRMKNEGKQEVGEIALVDPDFNEAMWVDADYFSELFNQHRPGVVMLQACEGGMLSSSQAFVGVASKVVQQNVPVVVAMQYEVTNSTASRFALRFYQQLAAEDPVDIAVQYARRAIALGPTQYRKRDFATPVIFMRVRDGYLFKRQSASSQSNQQPDSSLTGIPENLPRSGVVQFVGRERELETLHQQLQENERVAVSAIAGMGGIGKTELALQYALICKQTYQGGICWLRAKGLNVGTQIVQFGRSRLQLQPPEDLDLTGQVGFCWTHWAAGKVLVILDDVTDYEVIKPYLPPAESRFKVLMTTRLRLGKSVKQLEIDVLDESAALALLESLVGAERIQQQRDNAQKLCAWLGYLPLGLELVGRYFDRKPDLSLAEMQQRLEKKRLDERSLSKPDADMTASLGVAAAFELSWDILDEPTKQLGCLLSLFALTPIPWSLVEQCLSELDLDDLEELRDDNLLNLNLLQRKGAGIYQLHQLIREFFQAKQVSITNSDELKWQFCKAMVAVAQKIPETPTRDLLLELALTIPHMAEAATTLNCYLTDTDLLKPFEGLGRFYEGQTFYQQASDWYDRCLSLSKQRFGSEHLNVATSINHLAYIYRLQGRYSEAELLCKQVLEMRQRLLGAEVPEVADSLNQLAILYNLQGKYDDAEALYNQALEMKQRFLGSEHPDVADCFNNLAYLYLSQRRYAEAEPLFEQAIIIYKRTKKEIYLATSLNNLARLYDDQGRYAEAELLCVQALELFKHLLGEEHPDVANCLNNLAFIYAQQGDLVKAEITYIQALNMRQKFLGNEHPDVSVSMNDLAKFYTSLKKYAQAEPLYLQALASLEKKLGKEHPLTVRVNQNLSELRMQLR
ncbi:MULTISPECIES: tetratricopeptide repeat protein [Kamptonema]|uniref:tetratricopeptide repeat protein n=1 Tax=Kamptonema TaxID=1501433 RepID=UPI0001DACC0C|nr:MULTISPECIES: tetratricopeptide repeat protein [Kamptonema]CBN55057.1 NB-ARC domain protein (modular protein) [Kamptonema sp. PCC 6506]